jgi:hypothetical protein
VRNSTIIPKKKKLGCGCYDFPFSRNRCKMHATAEDAMTRLAEYNDKMIEDENLSELVSEADDIFSKFVRLSVADKDGYLNCFICGKRVHWKEAENMHYIKRGASLFLRFDLRNNKAGCNDCNCKKDGNYLEYAKKLESKSPGITDILYEEGNLYVKVTKDDIKSIILEYSSKVKELLKNINK